MKENKSFSLIFIPQFWLDLSVIVSDPRESFEECKIPKDVADKRSSYWVVIQNWAEKGDWRGNKRAKDLALLPNRTFANSRKT